MTTSNCTKERISLENPVRQNHKECQMNAEEGGKGEKRGKMNLRPQRSMQRDLVFKPNFEDIQVEEKHRACAYSRTKCELFPDINRKHLYYLEYEEGWIWSPHVGC